MSEAKKTPVIPPGGAKMKVGFNYPCYIDKFGDHLLEPNMPADFETFLGDCDVLDVKTVRVFLACDLNHYGHTQVTLDTFGSDWTAKFTPDAADVPKLVAGMVTILKALQKHESRGILSLVDFFAFNTLPIGSAGKYEMVTNPIYRKRFFDEVFEPLLKASLPFKSQIFAWEIMNEPRWADQDRGPNLQFSQFSSHIPLADLTSFLNEAIARVFKYLIPSTVGHALQQDIGQYPKGDIPQFHFYPSAIEILPSFAKTDAIVGEFGARPANKFPGLPGSRAATENPWPELGGKDLGDAEAGTFERLKLLHKKGYQLALLWPSEDKLPASTKFSNAVKNGIKKFNAWTPP